MNDKNITKQLKDSEIIKALECCSASSFDSCTFCPFMQRCENDEQIAKYALDIIERLNGKLDAVLEERNQAVADLRKYAQCDTCKHNGDVICSVEACKDGDQWEWRGVEKKDSSLSENTKITLLKGFMKGVE